MPHRSPRRGPIVDDAATPLEDGDLLMNDFRRDEIVAARERAGLRVLQCDSAGTLGDPARANLWICVCERGYHDDTH